jgi:hypothetical protein
VLEFRLLFEGTLPPSGGSNTRPAEKHQIRQSFHPQLRRLWKLNASLRQYAEHAGKATVPGLSQDEKIELGLTSIGKEFARESFQFVPLVTPALDLRCNLDILLLRPEEDRFIFKQGDIDGQLKTLFDALRLPIGLTETGGIGPLDDENPFFCLLQDDRLISEVRVTTDQLLLLPGTRQLNANDCYAVIRVNLRYKNARTFGNYFG